MVTATIFSQKFRQISILVKNFTINWFDGKKFVWQRIARFSTLCKMSLPYTKPLLSKICFVMRVNCIIRQNDNYFYFCTCQKHCKLIFVLFPPSKYLLSINTFYCTSFMAIISRRKMKRIKCSWMAYLIVVTSSIFILTTISRELWR